jgi:hypothetical protein
MVNEQLIRNTNSFYVLKSKRKLNSYIYIFLCLLTRTKVNFRKEKKNCAEGLYVNEVTLNPYKCDNEKTESFACFFRCCQ